MKDCYDPKAHFGTYPKKIRKKNMKPKHQSQVQLYPFTIVDVLVEYFLDERKKNNEPSLYFPMFYLRHHIIIMKLMLYYSFHIEMLRNYDASFKF